MSWLTKRWESGNRKHLKTIIALVAIGLLVLLPSFVNMPIPSVYAQTSEPLVDKGTKYSVSITSPISLFNGIPQGSATMTYSFREKGVLDWSNLSGINFTMTTQTFNGKKLHYSSITGNSSHTVLNFNKTGNDVVGSMYFIKQKSGVYDSFSLKVRIVGTANVNGNLCIPFSNPSSKTEKLTKDDSNRNIRVTFGGFGFDWKDSLSFNPTYSESTRSLCYAITSGHFDIDPVTIGTSTINEGVPYPNSRIHANAVGRWWEVYSDGATCMIRSTTSLDASSGWGNAVALSTATGCDTGYSISAAQNGNNLYYAINPRSGTTFTIGAITLNSDGTKTALIANTSITSTNTPRSFASTANDGTKWWVALEEQDGSNNYHITAYLCTTTCGTGSNWVSKKDITLSTTQNAPQILDVTSGVFLMYAAYNGGSISITTSATGTTWTTPVTTTSTFGGISGGATRNGDNVYFGGIDLTNQIVKSWSCAYPCSSSAPTEVTVDSATASSYFASMSYDSKGSCTLALIYGTSTTMNYRTSCDSGATWSAKTIVGSSLSIPVGTNFGQIALASTLSTTGGLVAFSWEEGAISPFNIRVATLYLPISITVTCTMDNAGPQATITPSVSSGAVTPSSFACDGTGKTVTATPGVTLTLSNAADQASSRQRTIWANSATATTLTIQAAQTSYAFTNYHQLRQDYVATPLAQVTWDSGLTAVAVVGTVVGTGSTTICSITLTSGQGAQTATACWDDYNRQVTVGSSTISGAPASSQWLRSGTSTFTQTTGGNSNNVNFYKQWTNNWKYSVTGGGSPTAPTMSCNQEGVSQNLALTTSNQAFYCDNSASSSATNPTTGSTSSERWSDNAQTQSVTSGGNTYTFAYYHQYACTCSYSVVGGGSPTAPTFTGTRFGGASTDMLSTTPTTIWQDNSASYSSTNPTTGSTSSERWQASAVSGGVSAAFTFAPVYYHQYACTCSYAGTITGFTAPDFNGQRFGSGTTDTLTATPATVWVDNSFAWSVTNPLTGSGTTTRAISGGTVSGTVSAAFTVNPTYYIQYACTCSYTVVGGGSPTAPIFNGQRLGSATQDTLTLITQTVWIDTGTAWTITANPIIGGTGERWSADSGTSGTATAVFIANPSYQHQYQVTVGSGVSDTSGSGGWVNSGATDTVSAGGYSNIWTINRASWFYLISPESLQLGVSCSASSILRTTGGVTFSTSCSETVTTDIFLPSAANLQVSSMFDGANAQLSTTAISTTVTEGSGATGSGWSIYLANTNVSPPQGGGGTPSSGGGGTGGGGAGGGVFTQVVYVPSPIPPTTPTEETTTPIPITVTTVNNQAVAISGFPEFDLNGILTFIESPFTNFWAWFLAQVNGLQAMLTGTANSAVSGAENGANVAGTSVLTGFFTIFSMGNILLTIVAATILSGIYYAARRNRGSSRGGVSYSPNYANGARVSNKGGGVTGKLASISLFAIITTSLEWFVFPMYKIHTPLEQLPFVVALAFMAMIGIIVGLVVALAARW